MQLVETTGYANCWWRGRGLCPELTVIHISWLRPFLLHQAAGKRNTDLLFGFLEEP